MRAVLQRVTEASVCVDGEVLSQIQNGFMILLGVQKGDDEEDTRLLADKIVKLRVFADENGRMNRSVTDVGGSLLVVSQFTLYANYAHGNRPDFLSAELPERANSLYEHFVSLLNERGVPTQTGSFGADMKVSLINDGPVTIVMDSDVLRKNKLTGNDL